jgi:hypothetical protein
MTREPVHEDKRENEPGGLVREIGGRPVLHALDDEDGIKPKEGGNEGEEGLFAEGKGSWAEFGVEFLADAGEIFRSVALTEEEDEGDANADKEAPLG